MRRVGARLSVLLPLIAVLAAAPTRAAGLFELREVHASAGRFNVINKDPLPEAGWEVSFAPRKFRWLPRWVPELSPAVGGMANAKGSLYAYAGFRFDILLGEAWRLTPQWGTGLYYADGGRGLGGPLEFRSGIELSRRVGRRGRAGLLFYHLSNAGIYERNPGSESMMLTYTARP
jgi:lipid A 3-O-deacylase